MKYQMTSKERSRLRSMAQSLDPVVMVGRSGITDAVVAALDKALEDHELVKLRFQDFKDSTRRLSEDLSERTDSALVATTGFTAVFWRENDKKK